MIYAALASLVAAACVFVAFERLRRLRALETPSTEVLVRRVIDAVADEAPNVHDGRALHRITLDEYLHDIDLATRGSAEWPRALARVSLASGTGCALLGMIERPAGAAWAWVAAAFVAGVAGTLATAWFGRAGDARSREVREQWSVAVRRARAQLD